MMPIMKAINRIKILSSPSWPSGTGSLLVTVGTGVEAEYAGVYFLPAAGAIIKVADGTSFKARRDWDSSAASMVLLGNGVSSILNVYGVRPSVRASSTHLRTSLIVSVALENRLRIVEPSRRRTWMAQCSASRPSEERGCGLVAGGDGVVSMPLPLTS